VVVPANAGTHNHKRLLLQRLELQRGITTKACG